MRHLIQRMAGTAVAFASLIALVFSFHRAGTPVTGGDWIVIGVFGASAAVALVSDVVDFRIRRPKAFHDRAKAHKYWLRRLRASSRVVLLTRDLTWVDEEMKRLLTVKCQRGELTILLPRPIQLAVELASAGATVILLPDAQAVRSRFVVVNAGQADPRVLIGREQGGVEMVQEFGPGDYPAFPLVEDLAELLARAGTPLVSSKL